MTTQPQHAQRIDLTERPVEQRWTEAGPVHVAMTAGELQQLQEQQQVTVAEPAALGLFGFATGTIAIGYVLSGFTAHSAQIGTAPALLVFAGLAQFIAGMWAFRRDNTFAATAFSVYGANNIVVATFLLLSSGGTIGASSADNVTLAIELFSFAYISLVLAAAAMKLNMVFVLVLSTLVPGFALSALGLINQPQPIGHIGGYFLIASAAFAFYAATAIVINSVYGRTMLPLFGKA